jgi:CheY-like chemotaxis protein
MPKWVSASIPTFQASPDNPARTEITSGDLAVMKLLIVEDSAEMRRMIKRVLKDLASEISECEDGSEALASFARHEPDWVLMDIGMKKMDGLTATRHLLAHWPQARVVIVTSHDDDLLREQAQQAGAVGYVLKENLLTLRQRLQAAA